jgi:MFS family permease
MGYVSDRYEVYIPMLASTSLSAVVVFLAWGFAKTLAPLIIFAILYGLFAGGYSVLYCRFATALTDESSTGLWLYSIFEFQRGASSIVGSLCSGFLVNSDIDLRSFGISKYQGVVLLVGSSMLASCLGGIGWFCRGQGFRFSKIEEVPETEEKEDSGLV